MPRGSPHTSALVETAIHHPSYSLLASGIFSDDPARIRRVQGIDEEVLLRCTPEDRFPSDARLRKRTPELAQDWTRHLVLGRFHDRRVTQTNNEQVGHGCGKHPALRDFQHQPYGGDSHVSSAVRARLHAAQDIANELKAAWTPQQ